MKRKIAVLALAFASSISAFAIEGNVKAGYDFFRHEQKVITLPGQQNERGFTVGAELIPYNKGIFEVGLGAEYNFGTTKAVYEGHDAKSKKMFIPVYALTHLNMARSKDNANALYLVNRLGGVAYSYSEKDQGKFLGGLYYGVGLGAEVHAFVLEVLYDGAYIPGEVAERQMQNKVGVKAGIRIGDYKVKAPVVEKEVVKVKPMVEAPKVVVVKPEVKPVEEVVMVKPVEEVKPVVVEKVKPVVVEEKMSEFMHANCAVETKVCIIYGFKVDGRVPNEAEKNALNEVVEVVNNYAKSGRVVVVGNTDSTGSAKYNQKLSVQRAKTVTKLLKEYGLKESIVIEKIMGEGETNPIDTNKTKLGRYHNRRVELRFVELER